MRALVCSFVVTAALPGCYLSHELVDGGDAAELTCTEDGGTCTEVPMPDLGVFASGSVGSCHIGAATAPAQLYSPCFRPCADVASGGCRETPLAPFLVTTRPQAAARDGHVYFGMTRAATAGGLLLVAMSADGDVLSAATVEASIPVGGAPAHNFACTPVFAALSSTAWAFSVRYDERDASFTSVDSAGALFFGPFADVAAWGSPSTMFPFDARDPHPGVVEDYDAAFLGPPVWSLDGPPGFTAIAAARSGDTVTRVVAIVYGEPVWLETDGTRTIAAHVGSTGVEVLRAPDDASIVAFATDGPAFVWVESMNATGELRAFTAPTVADAAALSPRRVADAPETHWGTPVGTLEATAFGRARIALVSRLESGEHRVLVVDDETGLAGTATLPAKRAPLALAFATHDQLDIATAGCGAFESWVVRLDVGSLTPLASTLP